MRFPRNARIFRGQLDVAPFVGVFFLFAIFLILESSLVFMPGVNVQLDLPEAAGFSGTSNPTVAVAVDRNGKFFYGNQFIREPELKAELKTLAAKFKERGADLTLVIQGDKGMAYEVVVQLEQMAREAGIKQVLQAVRPMIVPAGTAPAPAVKKEK
jgi:biopolymer transport protein ExbD